MCPAVSRRVTEHSPCPSKINSSCKFHGATEESHEVTLIQISRYSYRTQLRTLSV
jgi:hypothetical protein